MEVSVQTLFRQCHLFLLQKGHQIELEQQQQCHQQKNSMGDMSSSRGNGLISCSSIVPMIVLS